MKRLQGWLFNLSAAVSLLLCVSVIVLWVRSHRVGDKLYWSRYFVNPDGQKESAWWLLSGAGGVGTEHRWQNIPDTPGWVFPEPEFLWRIGPPAHPISAWRSTRWNRWGFLYENNPWSMGARGANGYNARLIIPYWSLLVPSLLLPCLWTLLLLRKWRNIRAGLCPTCGYDLRATPDRCPECGTVPEANGTATSRPILPPHVQ